VSSETGEKECKTLFLYPLAFGDMGVPSTRFPCITNQLIKQITIYKWALIISASEALQMRVEKAKLVVEPGATVGPIQKRQNGRPFVSIITF
jgi:hypothetical protein